MDKGTEKTAAPAKVTQGLTWNSAEQIAEHREMNRADIAELDALENG